MNESSSSYCATCGKPVTKPMPPRPNFGQSPQSDFSRPAPPSSSSRPASSSSGSSFDSSQILVIALSCSGALFVIIGILMPFATISYPLFGSFNISGIGNSEIFTPWMFGIPVAVYVFPLAIVATAICVGDSAGKVPDQISGSPGFFAVIAAAIGGAITLVCLVVIFVKVGNDNSNAFLLEGSASPGLGFMMVLLGFALELASGFLIIRKP
jgi:hypothetical protein